MVGKLLQTAQHALGEFFADGCPKLAAAISYYTLFALFPLAILGVAILGLVFSDGGVRAEIIQGVLDALPLREEAGRRELEQLLEQVTAGAGSAGALALAALAVSASGLMGAVRFALNTVWGVEDTRPPLTGKLLDILAVFGIGAVLAASLGITIAAREFGFNRIIVGQVLPTVIAFGVYLLVLRGVPAEHRPLRDLWPGALVAALGYTLTKFLFLLYLSSYADFAAVYASLATVVAFLVFTWLTANVFLLGAEIAASWPCVRDDLLEQGPDEPLSVQLRRALRGTVIRTPARPDDPPSGNPRSARAGRG